jgi:hypothetical protein
VIRRIERKTTGKYKRSKANKNALKRQKKGFINFIIQKSRIMFQLTSEISIKSQKGEFKFKGVITTEIVSTWDALTDTCTIELPKKNAWLATKDKEAELIALGDNPILKQGNEITVKFGLNGNNSEWFKGYISNIYTGERINVKCQDAMYLLKQKEITLSYEKVSLSKLLKNIIGNTVPFEVVADYELGALRINKATIAQILEKLNKDYFIRFFFRDGILYAGLPIVPKLKKTHKITYVISNNLEYIRKDEQKIKIKAVIMYEDNTKKEFEVGDKDGETRTVYKYNISESDMRKFCESEIDNLKYEGFKGTLTTFIEPNINHGDNIILPKGLNGLDEKSEGKYSVKKVTKFFRGLEARQVIELERRVN